MSATSIYNYNNYRQYLKDYYEQKKKVASFFSYRYISNKVGLDPGYIARVFGEKVHLAEKSIPRFASLLGLSSGEAEYFETLVHFNKAKTRKQTDFYSEKLVLLRFPQLRYLDEMQHLYFRKWYYPVIRSIIGFSSFAGDHESIARMLDPEISASEVKHAIAILSGMGLIVRDGKGVFRLGDPFVTTGPSWRSRDIQAYQRKMIELGSDALLRIPKERRDISTLTVSILEKDLERYQKLVEQFRQSVLSLAKSQKEADTVYQLNVQFFPLVRRRE
ncbi:MAG: TIGR02147 family protein [Chitinivibrionales bacterium]|nr:TIGR02147 family protein [Chitinivibrionales bacterium]MBD3358293.1 TIGR02147 family protein [Chitinivibrionales bacterium]